MIYDTHWQPLFRTATSSYKTRDDKRYAPNHLSVACPKDSERLLPIDTATTLDLAPIVARISPFFGLRTLTLLFAAEVPCTSSEDRRYGDRAPRTNTFAKIYFELPTANGENQKVYLEGSDTIHQDAFHILATAIHLVANLVHLWHAIRRYTVSSSKPPQSVPMFLFDHPRGAIIWVLSVIT